MSLVTFYTALRTESMSVKRGAPGARLVRFGIGRRAAATAVAGAPSEGVAILLGFSGALTGDLRAGDLVVASELAAVGEDETFPLHNARAVAESLSAGGLSAITAPIITAERLVSGSDARAKAASRGAVAVDLESRWFAPLAETGTLVVVRAIVDVPGKDVRSLSTPLAALRAGHYLARAARLLEREALNFSIQSPNEQAGDR